MIQMQTIIGKLAVITLAFEAIGEGPRAKFGDLTSSVVTSALYEIEDQIHDLYVAVASADDARPCDEVLAELKAERAEKEGKASSGDTEPAPSPNGEVA